MTTTKKVALRKSRRWSFSPVFSIGCVGNGVQGCADDLTPEKETAGRVPGQRALRRLARGPRADRGLARRIRRRRAEDRRPAPLIKGVM